MELSSAEPDIAALACYRQALRDGIAPLPIGNHSDFAVADAITAEVRAIAAADGLSVERLWDPTVWGNAADPCPVIVIGRFGVAYELACERHAVNND
jgi:hypothetical protein